MIRLKPFVILIILYALAFLSVNYNISLFAPFHLLQNYLLMPVIAIADESDVKSTEDYYQMEITNLKDEIKKLQTLNDIKTVLAFNERINATVIERNRNYWFNTIKIDKGSNDGIKKDMAVVNQNGLIGKISNVSLNNSEIKLITTSDLSNKTSVVIISGKEKFYGIINSFNGEYLEVSLNTNNVSLASDLQVSTTGMGGIYPSGILVGYTKEIKKAKYDVGLIVLVKPAVSFNDLQYVSVLRRE